MHLCACKLSVSYLRHHQAPHSHSRRGGSGPVPQDNMARSREAILAAAAVSLVSAAVGEGLKRRSSRNKKRRQTESRSDPEVLVDKLFGDAKVSKLAINVYTECSRAADAAAADRKTQSALLQLLALILAAFACACFMAVGVATGSFLLCFGSMGVAYFIAAPAAVGVRKHWGQALDEALDESIKTTGLPWDLAVI